MIGVRLVARLRPRVARRFVPCRGVRRQYRRTPVRKGLIPATDDLVRFATLLRERPTRAWRHATALLRGTWYAVYFRGARRDVRIALPFLAFGPVSIRGSGSVRIGSGCSVMTSVFRGLSIVTFSPDARVEIGARCALGGLTIRCRRNVRLGDGVRTAATLVQDALLCDTTAAARTGASALEVAPVVIGANAWIGLSSAVLCGAQLGDDVVVSAGAVCRGTSVGSYALVAGNPSGRPLPIAVLLRGRAAS